MKLIKIISLLFLVISGTLHAYIDVMDEKDLEKKEQIQRSFMASPADADHWFFEFKNKTKEPLFLTIICEEPTYKPTNYSITDEIEIPPSTGSSEKNHGYLRLGQDPFKPLTKSSYSGEGTCYILIRNAKNTFAKAWKLTPYAKSTQFNWAIATIYLTYEKGVLRLQTGYIPKGSKDKKTQSGLEIKYWSKPTITSVDPNTVIQKLVDIQKKMSSKK